MASAAEDIEVCGTHVPMLCCQKKKLVKTNCKKRKKNDEWQSEWLQLSKTLSISQTTKHKKEEGVGGGETENKFALPYNVRILPKSTSASNFD